MQSARVKKLAMATVGWLVLALWVPGAAWAHCDTLDGPVVKAAQLALDRGDITPVLMWVKKEHEAEVLRAFEQTLRVRQKGPEARELADHYFFETVVRVHREGEGAPYTGLKPAGTEIAPAIREADTALEVGSVDALVVLATEEAAAGIRRRFARTLEKKKRAEESVEAGREFVAAYVEFVHYVEGLHQEATGVAGEHTAAEGVESWEMHRH